MSSDDFGMFRPTEDWATDWWTWVERLTRVITQASIRVGAAVIAGGFSIAGANMLERQESLGRVTLAVAAIFAAWFVVSAVVSLTQRR